MVAVPGSRARPLRPTDHVVENAELCSGDHLYRDGSLCSTILGRASHQRTDEDEIKEPLSGYQLAKLERTISRQQADVLHHLARVCKRWQFRCLRRGFAAPNEALPAVLEAISVG
jgi:hypothetical protein